MENQKIALITFHNAYNYGACLQAYALQEEVKKIGYECEYINYINKTRKDIYSPISRLKKAFLTKNIKIILKSICAIPFIISRGRKFDKFYDENLSKTKKVYHNAHQMEELKNTYFRYIVGSDQVWNFEHNGGDSTFFLDFVADNSKKISYSSSFGMDEIPENLSEWYAKLLNNIKYISTREKKGLEIIKKLTNKNSFLVLDPVFFIKEKEWRNLIKKIKFSKNDYIFYYNNANLDISNFSKKINFKNKNKHILSASIKLSDFIRKKQKVVFSISPLQFLSEIDNSNLVVTTSFHCLAFSIILHKKFIVLLSGDVGRDERLLNLLEITGLTDRIYNDNMTESEIYSEIDYQKVDIILEKYSKYSENYLIQAIHKDDELLKNLKIE